MKSLHSGGVLLALVSVLFGFTGCVSPQIVATDKSRQLGREDPAEADADDVDEPEVAATAAVEPEKAVEEATPDPDFVEGSGFKGQVPEGVNLKADSRADVDWPSLVQEVNMTTAGYLVALYGNGSHATGECDGQGAVVRYNGGDVLQEQFEGQGGEKVSLVLDLVLASGQEELRQAQDTLTVRRWRFQQDDERLDRPVFRTRKGDAIHHDGSIQKTDHNLFLLTQEEVSWSRPELNKDGSPVYSEEPTGLVAMNFFATTKGGKRLWGRIRDMMFTQSPGKVVPNLLLYSNNTRVNGRVGSELVLLPYMELSSRKHCLLLVELGHAPILIEGLRKRIQALNGAD